MIKQITIILGGALLGFGLSCGNSDDRGGDQTCRSVVEGEGGNGMYICIETSPCEIVGALSGTCESIPTCTKSTSREQASGTTIAQYSCTGIPPVDIHIGGQTCRSTSVLPGDSFLCIESTPCRIIGAKPGTCGSIPTCSISPVSEENQGGTDTGYMCTGTPPE